MSRDLIMQVREMVQRYHNAGSNEIAKKLCLNISTVEQALRIISYENKRGNHT